MLLITCLLAVCVKDKVPSVAEDVNLTVLSAGVMLALWEGTVTSTALGISLCSNGLQCSHVLIHWQNDVQESGCTPADILHSPCVMCRHYTMVFNN